MYVIHNQDCLEGLKELETEVELTVTSPPYFNVKEYVNYESYSAYLDSLRQVFTLVLEKTKAGRMCCVNLSNIILPRESRNSESRRLPLVFDFTVLMEKLGWIFMEDILWIKPEGSSKNRNGSFFQHRQPVAYKPNVVNEYILVFRKPSPKIIDSIVRSYPASIAEQSAVPDGYERTNVWNINPETTSKHPAPYPVELAEKLIQYYSFVGDTVLDPYIGSGTTAVAAKNLGRSCIGFEIHSEYIDIALSRISRVTSPPPLALEIPPFEGERLRQWLAKKSKRFLLAFHPQKGLTKPQLASAVYEKFSSKN